MPLFQPTLVAALAAASLTVSTRANYTLVDSFQGSTFFDTFIFFQDADPTNGFVDYVGFDTAVSNKLVGLVNGTGRDSSVYLGADFQSVTQSGRQSVRVQSEQSWTHGLLVFDIEASPNGCAVWPAIWLLSHESEWPGNTGEIDVLEGVNDQHANAMTLHTSAGCALTNTSDTFTGTMVTDDCDVKAPNQPNNAGCSIVAPTNDSITLHGQSRSYATAGDTFNKQGGGVYVMLWESSTLTFWFFPRGYTPTDILANTPDPSSWTHTNPVARMTGCDFDSHLANLSLVINLTFCGNENYASALFSPGGCAAKTGTEDCTAFVADHPEAFANAYFLINGIRMFQNASDAGAARVKRHSGSKEVSKRSHLVPEIDLAGRENIRFERRSLPVPVLDCGAIALRAGVEQTGARETLALALVGTVVAVFSALWFP